MVRTVVPERWLRTIYGVTDATRLAAAVPQNLGKLADAAAGTLEVATGTASRINGATRATLPPTPNRSSPTSARTTGASSPPIW